MFFRISLYSLHGTNRSVDFGHQFQVFRGILASPTSAEEVFVFLGGRIWRPIFLKYVLQVLVVVVDGVCSAGVEVFCRCAVVVVDGAC